MSTTMRFPPALLVALTIAGTACAGASKPPAGAAPQPQVLSGQAQAVVDSLRYPYTEADVSFMVGMIQHHAQAVVISRWAPTHGASAAIQRLSARIINAQMDEITLMRTWLVDRNRPAPTVDSLGALTLPAGMEDHSMMDHGEHAGHDMGMPGMLSAAQLRELDAARGEEFDVLFLQRMIAHHRGAVTMVSDLTSSQGAGQDETVFKFAADVAVDQSTEIRRMLQMLLELGGIPPE